MKKKSTISLEGNTLTVKLEERLDTTNAMKLIEQLDKYKDEEDVTTIVFDATELTYIASTGIRAVLYADQMVGTDPKILFVGATAEVKGVFEATGIADFLEFCDSL